MRLYLAGADSAGDHDVLIGIRNVSVLVSYYYVLNGKGFAVIEWANENKIPVFLDSGAFSAMTLGKEINIDDYIGFCKKYQSCFDVIASLDVIMDWKKTEINHKKMLDAGINSIPCFHVGEPFSFLESLCSYNDYIAIGVAGNQKRIKEIMRFLVMCHKIAAGKKLHGFGMTSSLVMSSFDWYSVDSSSWINGRRFAKKIEMFGGKLKSERDLFFPRNAKTEDYKSLLRHNAETLLRWMDAKNSL